LTSRPDVLIVGTQYPTVGGIASAIDDQAEALRQQGFRIQGLNTGRRRRRRPGSASLENGAEALLDAARVAVAAVRRRPRLVVVHTVASPLLPAIRALALVRAGHLGGARVVTHIHAYDLEEALASSGPSLARAIHWLGRWSSEVVVLHGRVAASVRAVAPEAAIVVLPNCVDCELFRPSPVSPTEGPRVVFLGTAGRRKGVHVLLEALHHLDRPLVCDIAGGPAEEEPDVYDELLRSGAPLVASGRVVFHGEIDRSRALELLQGASLFVLPSLAEGMPVALLEAMSCAVPVVVTDVGAMGEVVVGADCGVVVAPGDALALAAAIESVLGDEHRRRAMGEAGRKAILARHCCDAVGDALARLYRSVAR
jgi:glycosyltransferase involved in cell wall biosynthesis